jgi:uncharacterized protein (TIGR02271 family)
MIDYNEPSALNTGIANERHGATLTAMFDSRAAADSAADRLRAIGVEDASIRITEGAASETRSDVATDTQAGEKGFFEALGDFFFPDDDRYTYAEGLSRGGYLLTVTGLSADLHERAVEILDDAEAVDLDQRETEWRAAGWSGYQTGATAPGVVPDVDTRGRGTDETVQVVEEQLRVGRRDVNLGRVRVRSYVREQPVSEAVDLTEERVTIERRPVDRPVSAGDDAFRDRSIEAEEHAEEAVISKEARVVEEINLRKDAETRTETISDTVRKTEVEIEDERDTLARTDRVTTDRVK